MDGLAAFWAARLDEDEAAAKAVAGPRARYGTWDVEPWYDGTGERADLRVRYLGDITRTGGIELAAANHAARHDPARTFRDVAADREILEMYTEQDGRELPEGVHDGRDPDEQECDEAIKGVLETVARIRAADYNGHPDYRAEWKPGL